jgi:uncharacterized membrane protein YhhN
MRFPYSSVYAVIAFSLLTCLYFFRPSPLLKIFPIIALIGFLNSDTECKEVRSAAKINVRFALIASAVGDVLLEIDESHPLYFLGGLLSFLFAHILYIRAFYTDIAQISVFMKLLLVSYYSAMMWILLPNAENALVVPIIIYGSVITYMVATIIARCQVKHVHYQSKFLSLIGALFFAVSDSILAVNKFASPIPRGKTWVMITYYAAQVLLAISTNYDPVDPKVL